ncbi:MAG: DUF11 domain-containing protein [Caulobacteraceae bacterium]|nr:DUF11 domain-containing protein [Caulobacteraceae bacterium]
MNHRILLAAAAATALMAGSAFADPLELNNAVYQEVEYTTADGQTAQRLEAATTVTPGEDVVYVIAVNNTSDRPADRLVITNPVPDDLQFLAAEGAQVSVDGGRRFGALSALTVRDGNAVRPATNADVTHVRWTVPQVAPGATDQVSFRARLK